MGRIDGLEEWMDENEDPDLLDLEERVAYGEIDLARGKTRILPDNESAWTDYYHVDTYSGLYHAVCHTDGCTYVSYSRSEACRQVEAHITRGHTDRSISDVALPEEPPF